MRCEASFLARRLPNFLRSSNRGNRGAASGAPVTGAETRVEAGAQTAEEFREPADGNLLFVAHGDDWVEARGSASRQVAGDNGDDDH